MGQRPNELTPHENLQHYWGAELRALRTERGMALADLAHQVHCDPSYKMIKPAKPDRDIRDKLK